MKQRSLRERLRKAIRLRELRWQYQVHSFVAWRNNDPARERIVRTSNRLGWLSRGYSPWYDGSAIHKHGHLELFGVVVKENMTPRNEALLAERLAQWRETHGIKMDAESVAARQAQDRADAQRRMLKYTRSLQKPPLIVRAARWLERHGVAI